MNFIKKILFINCNKKKCCILKCCNKRCCIIKCKKNDDTLETMISIDEEWNDILNSQNEDLFIEMTTQKSDCDSFDSYSSE